MQRPKVGDKNEEIIKQQEDYYKSKLSVIGSSFKRKSKSEIASYSEDAADSTLNKKSKSKFASTRECSTSHPGISVEPVSTFILGDIVERNYLDDVVDPPIPDNVDGFPRATRRRDGSDSAYANGRSIFSQQVAQYNANPRPCQSIQSPATQTEGLNIFGNRSFITCGPEASQIHEENAQRLSRMSFEDIKAEQQNLLSQLDPNIIQFLRTRRQTSSNSTSADKLSGGQVPRAGGYPQPSLTASSSTDKINANQPMEVDPESPPSRPSTNERPSMTPTLLSPDEMENLVHMNIIEEEKLEWTTDLPAPVPPPTDAPYAARFDFQGLLLPYNDQSIPVNRALHHHGDEPERPGYTLQELFVLGRSNVLQQRVVALLTIANIISKTKLGYYDKCFTPPLLHQLVDKSIFLLLRFSLDDSNIAVITAALNAMRNLLHNKSDEVWLDAMLGCSRGLQQPSLYVESVVVDPSEVKEMKDHQLVEEDMVKGALRTDLLSRLRYVLETLQPGANAVVATLEILTRIARHSFEAAYEIMRLPRLVDIIVKHFLTKHWEKLVAASMKEKQGSLYGLPVVQAVKLFRVIACRSRQLASDLLHHHGVMDSVATYVTLTQQMELKVRDQMLLQLNRESFYLWQTFLSYNLATEHFRQLQPVLVGLLRYHWEQTDMGETTSRLNHEHGAALIALVEQALLAAESQAQRISQLSISRTLSSIPNTVSVVDIRPYIPVLEDSLRKWLAQLGSISIDSCWFMFSMLKLISATMNCLASYYRIYIDLPKSHLVGFLEDMQEMNECLFKNLFANNFFKNKITIYMLRSSNLVRQSNLTESRDPPSLPSINSLCISGNVIPLIEIDSPLMFLISLSNFLVALHTVHKGLSKQCLQSFLDDEVLSSYIKYVTTRKDLQLRNNWFTRFETHFLVNVVKLAYVYEPGSSTRNLLFYDLAVRLITLVQEGDRHLLRDMMKDVVFNSDFIVEPSSLIAELKNLQIKEDSDRKLSKNNLLVFAVQNLPSTWLCYERALNLLVPPDNPLDRTTLTLGNLESALPSDWVYLPLLGLCNERSSGQSASPEDIQLVVCCLSWALIGECLKDSLISGVDITARYSRVATVFLACCDLFLEPKIKTFLEELITQFTTEDNLRRLDLAAKIPGLTSFYDLYSELLKQFAAVSYGSAVFAKYIVVPLRQKEDISFRRQVWFEHAGCIRVLMLPIEALPFELDDLLWPLEKDSRILSEYLRVLINGAVCPTRNPVLYTVALHHVAFFLEGKHDNLQLDQIQGQMKQSFTRPHLKGLEATLQAHVKNFFLAKERNLTQ